MSFSSETKSALAKITPQEDCCALAELRAMVLLCGGASDGKIVFCTENEDVAYLFSGLLLRCFDVASSPEVVGHGAVTSLRTAVEGDECRRVCAGLFNSGKTDIKSLYDGCGLCFAAFMRGAFITCGFVNPPEKSCHLEFVFDSPDIAAEFDVLLSEKFDAPKMSFRKGNQIVYLRGGNAVADALAYMGAKSASYDVINGEVLRSIRNKENRQTNFEFANISKTAKAAAVQTEAVAGLKKLGKFDLLSPVLKQTARLREENPETPLSELCLLEDPPVSKSQESKRLQKIVDLYNLYKR